MIGKLQYVVHSRFDIALAIGIVARFSINTKKYDGYKKDNEIVERY